MIGRLVDSMGRWMVGWLVGWLVGWFCCEGVYLNIVRFIICPLSHSCCVGSVCVGGGGGGGEEMTCHSRTGSQRYYVLGVFN